ncbi:hypothetical protein LWI29_032310 [Acer saccharum]|uniref:Uncharacterized protein n=1 Tax=Acer saccharum TaxID=4024 RepID=A0AA39TFS4_ACESA|nr:hypothetical protein LWI29_032310 [Acer saccharum]
MGDMPDVAFSAFEQDLFGNNEGDNEDQVRLGDDYGDDYGDDESPGMRAGDDSGDYGNALAVVPEVPEEMCVVNKGAEICGMEEWICVNGVSNVCESNGMGVSNVL